MAAIEPFLDQVRRWAGTRRDVLGVVLAGSWARGQAGPKSDVDLVIVAEDRAQMLDDQRWLGEITDHTRVSAEDWGKVQSLRVDDSTGLEVEFGVTDRRWLAEPLDSGTRAVLADGVKVVFERDGYLTTRLQAFL
jgi:predicted nucleotidyltransferase